ncbi:hypothetical protein ACIQNU_04585 [Streptomyces sp. NPDC091292]|uniref:hypothetical protein n=1 Tax=Streptomyces sp. NPDC091292 TaxID=3365991 RepID=UPI0038283E9D
MTDTWTSAFGGTRLEGPVDDWQHPDAHWTAEFEAARANEAAQPVPCPVCGTAVTAVDQESVYGMREGFSHLYESHAGTLGWLVTLHPCGHTLAK